MEIEHSHICQVPKIELIKSKVSSNLYYYCASCFEYKIENGKDCCFNPSLEFCQYEMSNGRIQLRKYCINCGIIDSENFKYSNVTSVEALPKPHRIDNQYREVWAESDKFKAWVYGNRKIVFLKEHDSYLHTSQWAQIRNAVLNRDNHICQGCLIVRATQVHHITYIRWKNEMAFDLISLCSSCHSKIHE